MKIELICEMVKVRTLRMEDIKKGKTPLIGGFPFFLKNTAI